MGIGESARSTLREALRVRQVTPRATTFGTPKGGLATLCRGNSPPH
ncbi:hypothetical protein [Fischerella thermalis]|nr:hypothetical protein [Fischerella thermalis]